VKRSSPLPIDAGKSVDRIMKDNIRWLRPRSERRRRRHRRGRVLVLIRGGLVAPMLAAMSYRYHAANGIRSATAAVIATGAVSVRNSRSNRSARRIGSRRGTPGAGRMSAARRPRVAGRRGRSPHSYGVRSGALPPRVSRSLQQRQGKSEKLKILGIGRRGLSSLLKLAPLR
jgi:hypothetical protein